MKLKMEWFRGLNDEAEKKERRELVVSARPTLEILQSLLQKRLADREATELRKDAYDSPSWSHIQADMNGSKRELRELIALLTLEET